MRHDPFAYDVDELVGPRRGSTRPVIIGLVTMLGIGVLSAMVLMEPPMAQSMDVTDEDRVARMLALAPTDRTDGQDEADALARETPLVMSDRAMAQAAAPSAAPGEETLRPVSATVPVSAAAAAPASPPMAAPAGDDAEDTAPPKRPEPPEPPQPPVRHVAATVAPAVPPRVEPPLPSPAKPAPVAPQTLGQAADGPYAIQFGSMSTLAAAEREIARMRLAAPVLFRGIETTIESTRLDDGRDVNRMRIAGVTRKGDARAWCRAFEAQGGTCYVIG